MSLINEANCEKLVTDWYAYAIDNVTEINAKIDLYGKTEEAASTIKGLVNEGSAEEAKKLAKVILKTFDKYEEAQSKDLSVWIAANTFKGGDGINGAFLPFHHLVESLQEANKESKVDKLIYSRSLFNFIFAHFEKLLPEQIDSDALDLMQSNDAILSDQHENQITLDYLLL